MADLVAELRASAMPKTHVGDCMVRAADEIERLREQVKFEKEENRWAYIQAALDDKKERD